MQPHARNGRPLHLITPTAAPYFEAARAGQLLLQKCRRDGFFFYLRSHCPHCLGKDWAWMPADPQGCIHSFTIDRMGQVPGLRSRVPFVIDLAEGPHVVGNILDIPFGDLRAGLPVRVGFEIIEGIALMLFQRLNPGKD